LTLPSCSFFNEDQFSLTNFNLIVVAQDTFQHFDTVYISAIGAVVVLDNVFVVLEINSSMPSRYAVEYEDQLTIGTSSDNDFILTQLKPF